MKTLTVAFSRPKSKLAVGSYLIRWFDGAPFSHATMRWKATSLERELVYEASHGSCHFISSTRFDEATDTITAYDIDIEDDEFQAIVQKCVDLAQVSYGYLELVGMAFERITGWRSPFRDGSKTFVCSELIGTLLNLREGDHLDLDLELAGPRLLRDAVAKMPGTRKTK